MFISIFKDEFDKFIKYKKSLGYVIEKKQFIGMINLINISMKTI